MATYNIYNKGLASLVLFDSKKGESVRLESEKIISTEDKKMAETAQKHGNVEVWQGSSSQIPRDETFDKTIDDLEKQLKQLSKENEALLEKNKKLNEKIHKLSSQKPLENKIDSETSQEENTQEQEA